MKTTLITFGFIVIFLLAYSTDRDIIKVKEQQKIEHQQDSIKWVNLNNRLK